jgi:NAD+ synthase (glutamine-hydrolysing)
MRVALCQINPTVGDLQGNAARILRDAARAAEEGAHLAVFPELSVCGYPPRDLLDRDPFVRDMRTALDDLAARVPPSLAVLVGFVDRVAQPTGPVLHNAAALLRGGRVERVIHKRLLPTYDVFDEDRYFEPGRASTPVEVAGTSIGITVCEDIWNDSDTPLAVRRYGDNPVAELRAAGAQVIVNLSASPFTRPKRLGRPAMLQGVARRHALPIVFVNQVGGNDDLLFDGDSSIHGPDGRPWARLARFEEDFACVEVAPGGPMRAQPEGDEATTLGALCTGVRDYAHKCGFQGAVLGLSGGIDSALTAAIATRALGADQVVGVAMPTRYSSDHSVRDAEALAAALGIAYRCIPIDRIFQQYLDELEPHLDALTPAPEGDVTFENVQSRIRCAVLMALSNRTGRLLLTTGNKSEMAVGYTTLYGDLAGGLAPISDVPKTFVYALAREVNRAAGKEVIPESTLTKPPSAELREEQKDEDSLPPYEVLDAILARFVEEGESADDIVAAGFDPAVVHRVLRLVRTSEYKRRQMPPGLILSRKAFGPGRRYPIAQAYRG